MLAKTLHPTKPMTMTAVIEQSINRVYDSYVNRGENGAQTGLFDSINSKQHTIVCCLENYAAFSWLRHKDKSLKLFTNSVFCKELSMSVQYS
jgi:hypothetical protein